MCVWEREKNKRFKLCLPNNLHYVQDVTRGNVFRLRPSAHGYNIGSSAKIFLGFVDIPVFLVEWRSNTVMNLIIDFLDKRASFAREIRLAEVQFFSVRPGPEANFVKLKKLAHYISR